MPQTHRLTAPVFLCSEQMSSSAIVADAKAPVSRAAARKRWAERLTPALSGVLLSDLIGVIADYAAPHPLRFSTEHRGPRTRLLPPRDSDGCSRTVQFYSMSDVTPWKEPAAPDPAGPRTRQVNRNGRRITRGLSHSATSRSAKWTRTMAAEPVLCDGPIAVSGSTPLPWASLDRTPLCTLKRGAATQRVGSCSVGPLGSPPWRTPQTLWLVRPSAEGPRSPPSADSSSDCALRGRSADRYAVVRCATERGQTHRSLPRVSAELAR
jgi:hypothetical protein